MTTNTASETVQQIIGTFIEDDRTPKPALLAWIQSECRIGCFKNALEECAKAQTEPLRVDLAVVEKVESDRILVRLPSMVSDHESAGSFLSEVTVAINPISMECVRL